MGPVFTNLSSLRFVFVVITFFLTACANSVSHEPVSAPPEPAPPADRESTVAAETKPIVAAPTSAVEGKVFDLVAEQMHVEKNKIRRSTRLIEDLKADELDFVNIVMATEERLAIEIPDEQAERVKTVGEMIDLVERLKSKEQK